jgi:hypothetical protein
VRLLIGDTKLAEALTGKQMVNALCNGKDGIEDAMWGTKALQMERNGTKSSGSHAYIQGAAKPLQNIYMDISGNKVKRRQDGICEFDNIP